MSIIYVDIEHCRVINDSAAGMSHRTRLDAAQARLAVAAGEPCEVARFDDITLDRLRSLLPSAMVISGNSADWSDYDFATLTGLIETIRAGPMPILGICGGHQLIGFAHGAPWGPLGKSPNGARDPDPRLAPGLPKQRGSLPIQVDSSCALFQGLGDSPVVFQSHYWQLSDVPAGFTACATSSASPIQAIARNDCQVFGVQFHPERYDDIHRDGETILRNFFAIARANLPPPIATASSLS